VRIGAGGPHIAYESWEMDIMVVIQCFGVDSLVEGCGPQRCGPPGGVNLTAYSAYLDCCSRAAACIAFYGQI
jgi:hypothetical protein